MCLIDRLFTIVIVELRIQMIELRLVGVTQLACRSI